MPEITIATSLSEMVSGGNGAAPGSSGQASPPPLRPGEDALWNWLDNLASESERIRREEAKFDSFAHYLDMFYGKHWPATMPSFRPPVVANELRTLILSEASDLTEPQLRIYITKNPHAQSSRDEDVERAFRTIWSREQVDLKLMYACCWALIVGTGFLSVSWDADAHHGFGDVTIDDVDPRTVLPDGDAINDKKWLYVMREQVLDIPEIRRLFPSSGWRVRPEDRWSVKDTKSSPEGLSSSFYLGPLTPAGSLTGYVPGYKKARARVLDCILRDDTTEETFDEIKGIDGNPVLDERGNPLLHHTIAPKYPNGRRIVGANGVILFDGDNPNPGGDFGLLRVVLEPALGRFWGTGFVHQTAELQLAANKGISSVVENALRLNNGMVVATTNTGLDFETFAGIPGQIVQINPGSDFKVVYPPPMPPDMVNFPFVCLDLQRRLLGFPDPRIGMGSRGNVSPELTETEIAQAQATTRLRARLLRYTVQRLAEMIFARIAHGYLTPRMIPAVEGEQWKPVEWKPLDDPNKYAVYVDPASFDVMSRTMLRRLSVVLYKMQAIDRTALLETIGFPDWERTAERVDRAAAMSAYMKERAKISRSRR